MKTLDRTLRELTGYRLQRATGSAMLRYKAVFTEFGLWRTTFSCLSLIIDNPGLRQSQLGDALAIERPNLVKIVEDLSYAGLILRETSKSDSRAYALSPTPKGKALFQDVLASVKRLDAETTRGLSDSEIAVLQRALTKVEENLTAKIRRSKAVT